MLSPQCFCYLQRQPWVMQAITVHQYIIWTLSLQILRQRACVMRGSPERAENAGAWRPLEGTSLGGCPGVVWTALVETLHPLHSSSRALWKYLMLKDRWKMDLLLKSRGRSVFHLGSESPQAKWGAGGYQCPMLPEEEEEPACAQWAQRQHPVLSSVTEGQV